MQLKKEILFESLLTMCRPLARLSLRHAIGVQEIIEIIKKAFIECATESISDSGNSVNISRLSIATGLHRRDVSRLFKNDQINTPLPNLLSRIVAAWETHPDFTTKQGAARVLRFEGSNNEFKTLVHMISSDLHPGTILFQLEHSGAVERTSHGVRLVKAETTVAHDPLKAFELLSRDMEDLPSAVEENLAGDRKIPHLHGRTEYDNVLLEALPKVEEWLLKEGSAFHQRARAFISAFDRDLFPHKKGAAGGRVALVTFSFSRKPPVSVNPSTEKL